MVEFILDRLNGGLDVPIIEQVTSVIRYLTFNNDVNFK